ncbi:phage virion morphogenesis protein [Sphingomonas gilva]|uniref:Phage virion morphogenesis protein n=1 Tax=Sphingomonas gilva TaxID=2305907 RepID=A0A396RLK6_9SPHN|nr:phage virion morphogenesis protein [Sphingomonas gilva]RHW17198.1 phage virion morphogenesis protein [Sphingomonas gilva]
MSAAKAIEARIDGVADLERKLGGLLTRFGNLTPLMDRFGMVLVTSTVERFDDERDPQGDAWLPSIRKQTEGGKTLTDKGLLRLSQTHIASRDQVEWGSNLRYARAHNDGAIIRAKGGGKLRFKLPGALGFRTVDQVVIPQREFLGVSADDREELEAQTVEWVAEVAPEVEP